MSIINILWTNVVNILNLIFNPILLLDPNPTNPALSVLIIAFVVSLISTVASKYLVNQDEIQTMQGKIRNHQQELIEARKNNDADKIKNLEAENSSIMELQTKLMSNQLKPTLITTIPIF